MEKEVRKQNARDLTQGNIWKQIITFSLPILIGNLFQTLYNMVDTIIVGRFISTTALAAVGATGSLCFLVIGFAMGMASGFAVIVSQRFGAGEEEQVKKSIGTAIWLAIAITVILSIIALIASRPLLLLMNTPDDIIADSTLYIRIIYGGIAATIYYNLVASIVRALGDSRTPLYFLIFSSCLNVVLDIVLIVVFQMGVAGAAFATVFAQLLSAVLCTLYSVRRFTQLQLHREHMKFDKELAKSEIRVGLPMALQFSVTAIGVMVLQSALNLFGSTVIAAFTAASKVEQLFNQLTNSLGMAMATYCGQNLGAGKWDRIRKGVRVSVILALAVSFISMAVLWIGAGAMTSLFMSDPTEELLYYGTTYLHTIAFFMPFLGMLYIFRNTLQGLGDSFFPMLGGFAELLARFVIAFTLPGIIGYMGICLASPLAWIAAALLVIIRYLYYMHKKRKAGIA